MNISPPVVDQYRPDAVFAESAALSAEEQGSLVERGHTIRPWPGTIGNMQLITWDYASGRVEAASVPRRAGGASVR